jgi:hypothetical protein
MDLIDSTLFSIEDDVSEVVGGVEGLSALKGRVDDGLNGQILTNLLDVKFVEMHKLPLLLHLFETRRL